MTTPQFSKSAYLSIEKEIAPTVMRKFLEKARDYRDAYAFLGSKGQFSDINRKFQKLKSSVWDGHKLEGEQPAELVEDIIGHCYLLLWLLDYESKGL